LLARSIRNRDAHAYVPNVRDQHQSLVPVLFTDVFNLLISWVDGGMEAVERWREQAGSFIAMLREPMDSAGDDAELAALIERLKLLKELGNARELTLGKGVADRGLGLLRACPALISLKLHSPLVTDAGLKELTQATQLGEVKIYGAAITDAGLKHLAHIQRLSWVGLAAPKVRRTV
jgi:hypothetical protein